MKGPRSIGRQAVDTFPFSWRPAPSLFNYKPQAYAGTDFVHSSGFGLNNPFPVPDLNSNLGLCAFGFLHVS
jgi:hypothetical protein